MELTMVVQKAALKVVVTAVLMVVEKVETMVGKMARYLVRNWAH